jgi:hypothetical protein
MNSRSAEFASFVSAQTPLLSRGGVAEGRGGVGQKIVCLTSTTPSALGKVASRSLLGRASFPSSAEEGSSNPWS